MIMIGTVHYMVNKERRTMTRALRIDDKLGIRKTNETLEKALQICAMMNAKNENLSIQFSEFDIIREIDPNFSDLLGV